MVGWLILAGVVLAAGLGGWIAEHPTLGKWLQDKEEPWER